MWQIKSIVAVLIIAVYLENIFTLGDPLILKKLQVVDRQHRQKDNDASARCKKVCPDSGEFDWLFDWFFDDDDEDCVYMCDITIHGEFKPDSRVTTTTRSTDTKTTPSTDTKPHTELNISDKKDKKNKTTSDKEDKEDKEEDKKDKDEDKKDKKEKKEKDKGKTFIVKDQALPN